MNHIELTIADLTAARARADFLIQSLQEFQSGVLGVTTAPTAVIPPRPVDIITAQILNLDTAGTYKVRAAAKPAPRKPASPPMTMTPPAEMQRILAVAGQLPEPFKRRELAAQAGILPKQADNFINNRVLTRVFTRISKGLYKRGPKFPKLEAKRLDAPAPRPSPPRVVSPEDKPTTLGGAMKLAIAQLPTFTGEDLRAVLARDKDYAKLMEQHPTGVSGNLVYWTNQGYLSRQGEDVSTGVYRKTNAGVTWFSRAGV